MRIWKEMKFLAFLGINTVILQILQCIVLAGPARRSSRMIREVYPEIESEKLETSQAEVCIVGDVVYGAEEPVPADQPCLKCKCEPPGVQCETTRCMKKPGCKAIHKPNECCPEYQCECEYRNNIYANGERLETSPGGECKVCYCRGGEVQCAEVSCYIRSDCEGRTVLGQCCPKYDHCPPREPLLDRSYTSQPLSAGTEAWSSNSTIENPLTTNSYQEVIQKIDITQEENNPTITIQEIIPDIKEIPITGPPKREINLLTKTTNKIHDVSDTETESSEISEIYHHPPPILKIGDQLLVLKKGELIPKQDISTPRPVITVIGAEGLQRGTEDSAETHEITAKNYNSLMSTPENDIFNNTEIPEVSLPSTVFPEIVIDTTISPLSDNQLLSQVTEINEIDNMNTKTESTTDIEHLIQKVFEEEITVDNASSVIPILEEHDTASSSERTEEVTSTVCSETSTKKMEVQDSVSEFPKIKHEEDVVIDQSPEYPPLPDIMIPQTLDETDHDANIDEHLNVTVECDKNCSTVGHPLINAEASLPKFLLDSVAPSDQINDKDMSKSIKELNNSSQSVQVDRSKETIEDTLSEESGEFTTSSNDYSVPMFSVENASVESIKSNLSDLLSRAQTLRHDVEVIDTHMLRGTKFSEVEEKKKFPNKFTDKDALEKESEVYKLLNDGLKTTPSHIIDNKTGNEDVKAEAIFRELLEEATSSIPPQQSGLVEGREKESALLQRVSEAIVKYQAKESKESLDASILGILREFFSSQYKNYEKQN